MYPEYMHESLKKVDETRPKRLELEKSGKAVFPPMTAEERQDVLTKFHPDEKPESRRTIHIGPNKGELLTTEVADMLESHSRIDPKLFRPDRPGLRDRYSDRRRRGRGLRRGHHRPAERGQIDHLDQAAHGRRQFDDVPGRDAGGGHGKRLSDDPLSGCPGRRAFRQQARSRPGHDRGRPRGRQMARRSRGRLGQESGRLDVRPPRRRNVPEADALLPGLHRRDHHADAHGRSPQPPRGDQSPGVHADDRAHPG